MKKDLLQYWSSFGYQLGRMEFMWGSNIPEAKAAFPDAKKELLFLLGNEISPSEKDFRSFSNDILIYFLKTNPDIYTSILIGICIQRYQLGKSVSSSKQKELIDLAKSSLKTIPNSIVPDIDLLFSAICMSTTADSFLADTISKVYECILLMDKEKTKAIPKGYIFISYSSKEKEIASMIRQNFENNGIKCWMAPSSIPIGGEYTEVITNAIEQATAMVLILSENSQKSVWVPKELDIALTSNKIIFPIHIDQSELTTKMKFRLSNAQIEEAYEKIESCLPYIIKSIKEYLAK